MAKSDALNPRYVDEMTPKEAAEYESAMREIAEKVPEMIENFKPESLEPDKYQTDAIMKPILAQRDAARKLAGGGK